VVDAERLAASIAMELIAAGTEHLAATSAGVEFQEDVPTVFVVFDREAFKERVAGRAGSGVELLSHESIMLDLHLQVKHKISSTRHFFRSCDRLLSCAENEAKSGYDHPSGAHGVHCCSRRRRSCQEAFGSAKVRDRQEGRQSRRKSEGRKVDACGAHRNCAESGGGTVGQEGLAIYRIASHPLDRLRRAISDERIMLSGGIARVPYVMVARVWHRVGVGGI
jgi:hypothetical protein